MDAFPLTSRRCTEQHSHRIRCSSTLADHASDVFLRDTELENGDRLPFHLFYLDLRRIVYQGSSHKLDKFLQIVFTHVLFLFSYLALDCCNVQRRWMSAGAAQTLQGNAQRFPEECTFPRVRGVSPHKSFFRFLVDSA